MKKKEKKAFIEAIEKDLKDHNIIDARQKFFGLQRKILSPGSQNDLMNKYNMLDISSYLGRAYFPVISRINRQHRMVEVHIKKDHNTNLTSDKTPKDLKRVIDSTLQYIKSLNISSFERHFDEASLVFYPQIQMGTWVSPVVDELEIPPLVIEGESYGAALFMALYSFFMQQELEKKVVYSGVLRFPNEEQNISYYQSVWSEVEGQEAKENFVKEAFSDDGEFLTPTVGEPIEQLFADYEERFGEKDYSFKDIKKSLASFDQVSPSKKIIMIKKGIEIVSDPKFNGMDPSTKVEFTLDLEIAAGHNNIETPALCTKILKDESYNLSKQKEWFAYCVIINKLLRERKFKEALKQGFDILNNRFSMNLSHNHLNSIRSLTTESFKEYQGTRTIAPFLNTLNRAYYGTFRDLSTRHLGDLAISIAGEEKPRIQGDLAILISIYNQASGEALNLLTEALETVNRSMTKDPITEDFLKIHRVRVLLHLEKLEEAYKELEIRWSEKHIIGDIKIYSLLCALECIDWVTVEEQDKLLQSYHKIASSTDWLHDRLAFAYKRAKVRLNKDASAQEKEEVLLELPLEIACLEKFADQFMPY